MSLQIEIVQSEKDERDLVDFLLKIEPLCAVPRSFPTSGFDPKPLGEEVARRQTIFRAADIELVRRLIQPVDGRQGYSLVISSHGVTIEWTRSERSARGGYVSGRFFFKYESPECQETTAALNRVMTALVRYVRKTSPKKSNERYPFYVGPHLAAMVDRKKARVVWPSGEIVDLVANTKG